MLRKCFLCYVDVRKEISFDICIEMARCLLWSFCGASRDRRPSTTAIATHKLAILQRDSFSSRTNVYLFFVTEWIQIIWIFRNTAVEVYQYTRVLTCIERGQPNVVGNTKAWKFNDVFMFKVDHLVSKRNFKRSNEVYRKRSNCVLTQTCLINSQHKLSHVQSGRLCC